MNGIKPCGGDAEDRLREGGARGAGEAGAGLGTRSAACFTAASEGSVSFSRS